MLTPTPPLSLYQLDDRYTALEGRVFLTGTQALVRIMLDQARRDKAAGLNTRGFVSGYRGSPLGGVDQEMVKAKRHTEALGIDFLAAVNEELGATAVLGTQGVETHPKRECDGVFGMWYGKGPGVDRAADALKHGNVYGSSPHGGVLVVAGDDHGCASSSMPHQSDAAFISMFIPTLHPASIEEYQEFGDYGFALSRFSGCWVGFKAITEIVESAASVTLQPPRSYVMPPIKLPPGGLHYRWQDTPGPHVEERIIAKKEAVLAFVAANPICRTIYNIDKARYGIITTGKAHLDTLEALRLLGLNEAACRAHGIDLYKVGMVWPLPPDQALGFIRGKLEVLVIEEKRGIIESQLKEYFYDHPGSKPKRMVGKTDEDGAPLVPWVGELSPRLLAPIIAQRLNAFLPHLDLPARAAALAPAPGLVITVDGATRTPYFCSGCPHNTSTRVPEGSQALAGIGCHVMATWMDRNTSSLIQMGGEGVNWAASSRFTGMDHVFQNLGDGTYYHSGSLAIRQAIAAGANITYKILYNDAVAMTGGQPVDGPVSVEAIAQSVRAEGVERIAIVSDDPAKFAWRAFPHGVSFHDRAYLDAVQRELREVKGVSVLIYEQTCATEKRRRRKRGLMEDPNRFAFINDLVCEGCGDCSVASNCLSVEPKETEFGRKRQINQSNCNKDFSCIDGFCPSFVTVTGGTRRKPRANAAALALDPATLPLPTPRPLTTPLNVLITGVGGTGVVSVGQIAAMAAHLEGKGASVLNYMGFAQKYGAVLSYLRLADRPEAITQPRIDVGAADVMIGCDTVVSSSPRASGAYRKGMKTVLNTAMMPTGDIVQHRDADLRIAERVRAIAAVTGEGMVATLDANELAERLLGDAVFANMIMLGAAWQQGFVPVSLEAMQRAIDLNAVAVERNRTAFGIGRFAVAAPERLTAPVAPPVPETLDAVLSRRAAFLTDYQNEAYASRYRASIGRFSAAEARAGVQGLALVAAKSLFKLMAYKDEYEVARLHLDQRFLDELRQQFEGDFTLTHHLAPTLLPAELDPRGRPRKRAFGPWIRTPFRLLARMRGLRGTWADPFGRQADRRMERALIGWYEGLLAELGPRLTRDNADSIKAILAAPMDIRGFGPVKDKAVAEVKARVDGLMRGLR